MQRVELEQRALGRYTLLGKLGAGGMGVVYRARDASTGRVIALKQQLSALSGENTKVAEALFQREFHTLSGLKHPRIIEVYDYGHDERGPYYTMELLDGKSLRELAPLPYREACRHVRDVASSLALLHARRLIHCDVSPNNVRLSGEGRAKLLDFGALATFGTREHVIGTPASIAPEAVQLMPLDQRTDLYSLGALLYWALTGTHAYPARTFTDLFEVWKRPVTPPSSLASDIPRALDELVLSLLSMDPLARPPSAALIIDRLNAIAELEPESEEHGAQSYLLSTPMVGRQQELARLIERIERTRGGHGGAVLIEGASGIGKSRLLHELCVEAQLRGLTVVQASAETALDSFALVHTLAANLLHVAPDVATAEALPYLGVLGHLSKPLHEALGGPALDDLPGDLGERRARLQTALHAWFLAVATRRPLLLAVDNAQAADYNSAAFLAALASDADNYGLFVASTRCSGTPPVARQAFKTLQNKSARVKLTGLDVAGCEALVRALFGEVSNTGRLARWLHELGGGHPDYCIGLVQLLVAKRIARYVDGTWVLPLELTSSELPSRLDELLATRLARLSPHARALSEALAVHARALSIEHCLPLLGNEARATVHHALDELVAEEILMFEANRYRFCHEGMREAVLQRTDAEQRRRMHRNLGDALLSGAGEQARPLLEAGLHLIQGGEETRGADVLAKAGRAALTGARAADDAALAVRALSAAIDVYKKQRRSEHELAPLLLALAPLCYYVDWRLAKRYGRDALELGFRITGLTRALELKRYLGRKLALVVALALADVRFRRARKRLDSAYNLRDAIIETCATVPGIAGVYGICLDAEGGRDLVQLIEPLQLFGRQHIGSVIYDNCSSRYLLSCGRETEGTRLITACRTRLETTEFDAVIGPGQRKAFYAGDLFSFGLIKASAFGSESLECARRLDELGIRIWSMVADQIRMMYHANRGELDRAKAYQQKIELHVVQGGTTWQTDIFLPVGMLGIALLSRDALAVRECWEQLVRRGEEIPSLRLYADAAHAGYLALRGNTSAALPRWENLVQRCPANSHVGWIPIRLNYADALNSAGEHARARELVAKTLEHVSEAELKQGLPFVEALRQLALAEAGLGNHAEAVRILDSFLAEHAAQDQPLILGMFHKARAQVALAMADPDAFRSQLAAMERLFRDTNNPSLIAQCEQLAREGVEAGMTDPAAHASPEEAEPLPDLSGVTAMEHLFRECRHPEERWDRALKMVLARTAAQRASLYLLRAGGLHLVATVPQGEPPAEIVRELTALVSGARMRHESAPDSLDEDPLDSESATDSDHDSATVTVFAHADERQIGEHQLFVLSAVSTGALRVVGGIVVSSDAETSGDLGRDALNGIARALWEAGDVSTSSGEVSLPH